MFRKRFSQPIPELNTTSTADISFMLLIFFLVTSSMDTDKGLMRQMAPPPQEQQAPQDINRDLMLRVEIDAEDRLSCDGEVMTPEQLSEAVIAMASVNRTEHVVSVEADPATTYEAYFRMQDAIATAYHTLRDRYAQQHYGCSLRLCTSEQRQAAADYYPQRISEVPITKGGRP